MEISGKRMYSLLKKLNFERLSTFEGEKRGAQIIADEIKSIGAEPHIETFMAPRYEIKKAKFEDIYANIPNNQEATLGQVFGDYMQLPPEEERIGHGLNEVDFGKY